MKTDKIWLPLAVVFWMLLVNNVKAGTELLFTIRPQDGANWCWAACSEMVLRAYGFSAAVSQQDLANYAVGGLDATNAMFGYFRSVDRVLEHFGPIYNKPTAYNPNTGGGNLDKKDIIYEINGGRPIMVGWWRNQNPWHMVLIRGYEGSGVGDDIGKIIYINPDYGIRESETYASFVNNGKENRHWGETLRMTTKPRVAIPVGRGPQHYVWLQDQSCTQVIGPSPQTLTFQAVKLGDIPTSWQWKLVFPHSTGDAVVASWTTGTTQKDLTWSIPNFSMPGGYAWKFNFDGELPGRIEVVCLDPNYHCDAIDVLYVPNDLYAGILVFENQTVSSSHPEIFAHELIETNNDQFLAGGDISFLSGARIDIKNGVTINNGSFVDFVVDPTLR